MEPKVQRVGKTKQNKTDGFCLIPTVVYKVLRKRMFCFSTKILKRYIVTKKWLLRHEKYSLNPSSLSIL